MQVLSVNSSAVNTLQFSDVNQTIEVEFTSGRQYSYESPDYELVKANLIQECYDSENGIGSVGKLLNRFIREEMLINCSPIG